MYKAYRYFTVIILSYLLSLPSPTQASEEPDLTDLPLESLMNMTVTSVSKKSQALMDAPAAAFIISSEDIKRSGAHSIPEVLRMVPGLEVARIDGANWAITARGFNGRFANKLLVLLDGRSVYSNLYSGVFWGRVDTILDDIERIEVIRGPGAALWGANAVNGIINIITKHSNETTSTLIQGGIGTEEGMFTSMRRGFQPGESTTGRIYAKYLKHNGFMETGPYEKADQVEQVRSGFRVDSTPTLDDTITILGDVMYGEDGMVTTSTLPPPTYYTTSNSKSYHVAASLLGRLEHRFSNASELTTQLYYEYNQTHSATAFLPGHSHILDLDVQHRLALLKRHDIVWGGGFRIITDDYKNSDSIGLTPASDVLQLVNLFVQDDITVLPKQLHLILGSKFEHNSYTGIEIQPSVRILWTPTEQQSLWSSVSRAVRTPSRGETSATINNWQQIQTPAVPPVTMMIPSSIYANGNFKSEEVIAYELGYRQQLNDRSFFDLTAFYNQYRNLRTLEPFFDGSQISIYEGNNMRGTSYGIELSGEYQPFSWLRLQPAYTALWMDLDTTSSSVDTTSAAAEKLNPRHQISLRSSVNLGSGVTLDAWVRFVDTIKALNTDGSTYTTINPYTTLDLRLAWHPLKNWEISLVGRNLLEPHHQEFTTEIITTAAAQVQRSVYGMITWKY